MRLTLIRSLVIAGTVALSLSAQDINQRRENQQDRIAQGVESGQMTAGETANVERREAHVNREIRRDRRNDGGHLTAAQRQRVNRQQNHLSNSIYRDKHNDKVQ